MKLNLLCETPLTARGFPEEGNEDFVGAGERTDYVNHACNRTVGFRVSKKTRMVSQDGDVTEIDLHQRVYVVAPGKLFRGGDLKLKPTNGIFTLASLKSMQPDDALGYMPLNHIVKPAGKKQSRIQGGASSQDFVANHILSTYGADRVKIVSTAKRGSNAPDVVLVFDGEKIQFEVKGTEKGPSQPITFFDKSMRRGKSNDILDEFAKDISHNEAQNFTELVDMYKKINPKVGFAGDEGVGKSGKYPKEFQVTGPPDLLHKLRKTLIDHFAHGDDNYFAVHFKPTTVEMWHTGHGPNPLKAPMLPDIKSFKVTTYGGPSGGATRTALKVKLA